MGSEMCIRDSLEDPSYVEPGNASQNYGGWKWVNGSYLRDTYVNWSNNEPNNAGGFEHYAQFEYSNDGKQWERYVYWKCCFMATI